MLNRNKKLALAFGVFSLLISGIFFWKTSSTSGTTDEEQFHQGIRNALAEINLPTESNRGNIDTSSNNLANFIYYRSGIQISPSNKTLIKDDEQKSWDQSKKVTQAQLAQILTEVAFDKLVTLSDSDINNMTEILRGFNAQGLSSADVGFRNFVRLRADGEGLVEPAYFISQMKSLRDSEIAARNSQTEHSMTKEMARTALYNRILNEITKRANYLSDADPTFFGNNKSTNMTPMQAMLITYSIVADDELDDNQAGLQARMISKQEFISQHWNESYPSPQNYRAFGTNGYWYSAPTDLLLDDATTTKIMNLIKERGGLQ